MKYVMAHDLGTSGNKATLYDEAGKLVASGLSPYGVRTDLGGVAEQNAEDWWVAVCRSSIDLLSSSGVRPHDIACVTFSGQMMGCLPVDSRGEALRPSIIWADMRAERQGKAIQTAIPPREFYRITGHRPSSSYGLAKLLWIRDQEPELFARTAKVLQAKDFIVHKLSGVFATDYSDAGGMGAFDLLSRRWSDRILSAVGLDAGLLPEPHPSTATVGRVHASAARATGLLEGTPIVIGGGDGSCATVGAGVVRPGVAYNVLGSSSWVSLATDEPIFDPDMRTFNWVHLDQTKYSPCGTMQAAGYSIAWMRSVLAALELRIEAEGGQDAYALIDEAVRSSPPGAKKLLFLPYLLGERSPRWNPDAKGAFIGLTASHGKGDVFRSVFEGVAFNLRTIIAGFSQVAPFGEIRLIGGGAKSAVWRRILADVWGLPVLIPAYLDEATSLGAAIAGGVGVGMYPDFSVAERFNPVVEREEPESAASAVYDELYPVFEKAYASLVEVFADLS